jgi:hypothetical protein
MYGRIPEHTIYSFSPKLATQTRYRIGEAGHVLLTVPRLDHEITGCGFLLEIPHPNHRVQPQTQACRPFGTLPFEGLRLLTAEQLLGVLERIFDGPAVVVTFQHLFGRHLQIGGKEEIVLLFAVRVSTDYQQNRCAADRIPQNHSCINQPLDRFASLAKGDGFPVLNTIGQRFQFGQFSA